MSSARYWKGVIVWHLFLDKCKHVSKVIHFYGVYGCDSYVCYGRYMCEIFTSLYQMHICKSFEMHVWIYTKVFLKNHLV